MVDGHPGHAVVPPWFAGEVMRQWWQATWVLRGRKEKWNVEEREGVGALMTEKEEKPKKRAS